MNWNRFFETFWVVFVLIFYLGIFVTMCVIYLWLAVQAWGWLL